MFHDRRSALSGYVSGLLSTGRTVFTADEAEQALGVGHGAFLDAAERFAASQGVAQSAAGSLCRRPAAICVLGSAAAGLVHRRAHAPRGSGPYYVGLLKAAELHGATHHAVMEFQVVTAKRLPRIRAGRSMIAFYFRKDMEAVMAGIEDRRTDTGTMKVSSAALTSLDLLRYPQASGGMDNIATVLSDLGHRINRGQLVELSAVVARPCPCSVSGIFWTISAMTS